MKQQKRGLYKKISGVSANTQCDDLKTIFLKQEVLLQEPLQNNDCLNWAKFEHLPYNMDVFFSRPIKNIEYTKIDENSGKWSAYYNVQLPVIIIERQNNPSEDKVTLKAVQITQLNGRIQKVRELVGDITELSQRCEQRIELKGFKLNSPIKLLNKKKCIHHIAICALKEGTSDSLNEQNLVGLSISGGFSLKSRKKSHQEKGLDTSYFKPIELTQNLQKRKGKLQAVNISNDRRGLQLYFTSPNIRHKEQTKSMQKIRKALDCAKESKCQYILESEDYKIDEDDKYYHFDTIQAKGQSGVSESDWFYNDNNQAENFSCFSLSNQKNPKKRSLVTMIDINRCIKQVNTEMHKIQVQYSEDTKIPMQIKNQLKSKMLENEEIQGQADAHFQQNSSSTSSQIEIKDSNFKIEYEHNNQEEMCQLNQNKRKANVKLLKQEESQKDNTATSTVLVCPKYKDYQVNQLIKDKPSSNEENQQVQSSSIDCYNKAPYYQCPSNYYYYQNYNNPNFFHSSLTPFNIQQQQQYQQQQQQQYQQQQQLYQKQIMPESLPSFHMRQQMNPYQEVIYYPNIYSNSNPNNQQVVFQNQPAPQLYQQCQVRQPYNN